MANNHPHGRWSSNAKRLELTLLHTQEIPRATYQDLLHEKYVWLLPGGDEKYEPSNTKSFHIYAVNIVTNTDPSM